MTDDVFVYDPDKPWWTEEKHAQLMAWFAFMHDRKSLSPQQRSLVFAYIERRRHTRRRLRPILEVGDFYDCQA
jgi:hypothetical protein